MFLKTNHLLKSIPINIEIELTLQEIRFQIRHL